MTAHSKQIPEYVLNHYQNRTRNFKKTKRAQIVELESQLDKLRLGCAFMPNGCDALVDRIDRSIAELAKLESVKSWGR